MSKIISNKARNIICDCIGKKINSPEQRLIQGVTGLCMQPVIDYMNCKADEETRAVSVARTIGKVIAGTIAGVAIRYGVIALTKRFSNFKIVETIEQEGINLIKKVTAATKKDIFMPEITYKIPHLTKEQFTTKHTNFIKMMGTATACITMIFTNFLIDAPLTKLITKWLTPTIKKHIIPQNPEVKENEQ